MTDIFAGSGSGRSDADNADDADERGRKPKTLTTGVAN
jgi:hypothetical protein